ncbi:PPR protein [Diplonema papillatum]|nr:PPR protein [Diplonema papillatum]
MLHGKRRLSIAARDLQPRQAADRSRPRDGAVNARGMGAGPNVRYGSPEVSLGLLLRAGGTDRCVARVLKVIFLDRSLDASNTRIHAGTWWKHYETLANSTCSLGPLCHEVGVDFFHRFNMADSALSVLDRGVQRGIRPTSRTFRLVLNALALKGDVRRFRRLLLHLRAEGVVPPGSVQECLSILTLSAHLPAVADREVAALQAYRALKKCGTPVAPVAFTHLLNASGSLVTVRFALSEMAGQYTALTEGLCLNVFRALTRAGEWAEGAALFKAIVAGDHPSVSVTTRLLNRVLAFCAAFPRQSAAAANGLPACEKSGGEPAARSGANDARHGASGNDRSLPPSDPRGGEKAFGKQATRSDGNDARHGGREDEDRNLAQSDPRGGEKACGEPATRSEANDARHGAGEEEEGRNFEQSDRRDTPQGRVARVHTGGQSLMQADRPREEETERGVQARDQTLARPDGQSAEWIQRSGCDTPHVRAGDRHLGQDDRPREEETERSVSARDQTLARPDRQSAEGIQRSVCDTPHVRAGDRHLGQDDRPREEETERGVSASDQKLARSDGRGAERIPLSGSDTSCGSFTPTTAHTGPDQSSSEPAFFPAPNLLPAPRLLAGLPSPWCEKPAFLTAFLSLYPRYSAAPDADTRLSSLQFLASGFSGEEGTACYKAFTATLSVFLQNEFLDIHCLSLAISLAHRQGDAGLVKHLLAVGRHAKVAVHRTVLEEISSPPASVHE